MGPSTVVITLWRVGCNMGDCSHVGLNRIALDSPLNLALEKKVSQTIEEEPAQCPRHSDRRLWLHTPGPAVTF